MTVRHLFLCVKTAMSKGKSPYNNIQILPPSASSK